MTDAHLFLSSTCPYCPAVLAGLSDLVKKGKLGELLVTNIEQNPEKAAEFGVRSVPWVRIGPFELTGQLTPAELAQWVERAGSEGGMADYVREQLSAGELATVEKRLKQDPSIARSFITLLEDPETPLEVRLGIDSMLESLPQDAVEPLADDLVRLSQSDNHRIRSDATWYLALTDNNKARSAIEARLQDENPEVREIAREALEKFDSNQH
ncbi:MAG: HEAT repeat domain-containing protein [Gammaproteobacteria bacterium]|nr:MAG: HEAT repeat domain-containing protein [Gammaproteobacteria bacterium]